MATKAFDTDEARRVDALDSLTILDTPPEQAFDDIAALASFICRTPVALVSLVDADRQWFKARVGFPECETDLERSVCEFVVAADQLIVIPDLTADPRTAGNPLVTGDPAIRFYAGAPLTTKDGFVMGALCAIDTQVRPEGLTQNQADALQVLARRTVDAMEMRRLAREHQEAEQVRKRLEAEAEAVDLRWRQIFQSLNEGFILGQVIRDASGKIVDWRFEDVNQAWSDLVGIPLDQTVGRTIREVFPGIEDERVYEFVPVVERGELVRFTRQLQGSGRWCDGVAQPAGPDRFVILFTDVTERIEATRRQDALLKIGDILRDCDSVADMTRAAAAIAGETLRVSRAAYGLVDADVEEVDIGPNWTADGVTSIEGRYRFDAFGQISGELRRGEPLIIEDVLSDHRTLADPGPMQALSIGSLVNMPVRERGKLVGVFIVQAVVPRLWSKPELAFIKNVADRLEAEVARLRAEEQQRIVNAEISHRLKNTLAIVQGVAAQTLRKAADPEALRAFDQRLLALGKAHDVLLQSHREPAELRMVVSGALEGVGANARCTLDGPPIRLNERVTLSTAMLIHELATNALKYGSLSVSEGRVDVQWEVGADTSDGDLVLTWKEVGGPPASPPAKKGFGSRLLRAGLNGTGGSELRYVDTGFEATFKAPRSQVE